MLRPHREGRHGIRPGPNLLPGTHDPGKRAADACFDVDAVASALKVDPKAIRGEIDTLVRAGAIHDIGEGLLEGRHYLKDPSMDAHLALEVFRCGPALRKALREMATPLTQRELALAMGVTRERARQITQTLVERGLANRKDDPETGSVFQTRTEALGALPERDVAA